VAADLLLLPPVFAITFAAVVGACVGSFLNVCITRWPSLQSVVSPPSRCPRCGAGIKAWQNIPVVSWLLLRGRCAGCALPISPMYPLVELTCGVIAAAFVAALGLTWDALAGITFAIILLGIAVTDAREMIIPDEFSLGGTVLGFALMALVRDLGALALPTALSIGTALAYLGFEGTLDIDEPGVRRRPGLIVLALAVAIGGNVLVPTLLPITIAAVFGFGSLWLVGVIGSAIAKREAMGRGDLKLMLMVGTFTSISGVLLTVLLGAGIGTLVYLPVAMLRRERNMELPFGVFLAPAALIAYLAGNQLIDWYLRISGLA